MFEILRYDIKPFKINPNGVFEKLSPEQKSVRREDVEAGLLGAPPSDVYVLQAELPFSFDAKVLINNFLRKHTVELRVGGRTIASLSKINDFTPDGDIDVSYSQGFNEIEEVYEIPVELINIYFWDRENDLAYEKIVWVTPGNPARMVFLIKARALKIPRKIAEIITAAEEAVKAKLAVYFI
jgi:hypothetical protein